jgi:hypothetical protein
MTRLEDVGTTIADGAEVKQEHEYDVVVIGGGNHEFICSFGVNVSDVRVVYSQGPLAVLSLHDCLKMHPFACCCWRLGEGNRASGFPHPAVFTDCLFQWMRARGKSRTGGLFWDYENR